MGQELIRRYTTAVFILENVSGMVAIGEALSHVVDLVMEFLLFKDFMREMDEGDVKAGVKFKSGTCLYTVPNH